MHVNFMMIVATAAFQKRNMIYIAYLTMYVSISIVLTGCYGNVVGTLTPGKLGQGDGHGIEYDWRLGNARG